MLIFIYTKDTVPKGEDDTSRQVDIQLYTKIDLNTRQSKNALILNEYLAKTSICCCHFNKQVLLKVAKNVGNWPIKLIR